MAQRGHPRGHNQSKLVRASEDRVYSVKVGMACMQTGGPTHAHTPTSLETYHCLSVWGRFNLRARDEEEGQSAVHLLLTENKMECNE